MSSPKRVPELKSEPVTGIELAMSSLVEQHDLTPRTSNIKASSSKSSGKRKRR